MDGVEVDQVPGTSEAHHDIAPVPGGSMVTTLHGTGESACSSIVEIAPDLAITPIIADVSTVYQPNGDCHPNSILYHPEDDTFTISDRNPNMYVKVKRTGELVWQLGGQNPLGAHIPFTWSVNHGHQLLAGGHFLFFNNNGTGGTQTGSTSPIIELELDEQALTATEVFRYSSEGDSSSSLGDVQRLANGNTLVTYSNEGVIHEIDSSGQRVQTFTTEPIGYVMHRESLYGPPPK